MARSTQVSPSPYSQRYSQRYSQPYSQPGRKSAPRSRAIVIQDTDSSEDGNGDSNDDSDDESAASTRTSAEAQKMNDDLFSAASDDGTAAYSDGMTGGDEDRMDEDVIEHVKVARNAAEEESNVDQEEEDAVDQEEEDAALLREIAVAAVAASQAAAEDESTGRRRQQRNGSSNGLDDFFAQLLDPAKRYDMRRRKYSEFVHPRDRQTLDVPKKVSKGFIKTRAEKFMRLFNLYRTTSQIDDVEQHLLQAFESFLEDLMVCFDHPKEAVGFNPFAALADLIDAGAVIRSPQLIQACSRLTLGADWSHLTPDDEKRIGPVLLLRLERLHRFRLAEIDDILCRWSGKFSSSSTCETCNTDLWEIFLLTTVLAMKKEGTRYIDVETASDTTSESGDESDDSDDEGGNNDGSDDERDDHQQQMSDGASDASADDGTIDPRLTAPIPRLTATVPRGDEEPPRVPTSGLIPRQSYLRNYGPNAYVLRIVSEDEFGCGTFANAPYKVCPSCGYRFDGGIPEANRTCALILRRAIEVAREQIAALPETIELP